MLDKTNAFFEAIGALLVWSNVFRLRRDKVVTGSNWWVTGYWVFLGTWFCFYYFQVGHYLSLVVQATIAAGNLTWLTLLLYYKSKQ